MITNHCEWCGEIVEVAEEKAAPELLEACEAALVWVALGAARHEAGAEAIENAKADLLRLQLAIAKAGGTPGRGIDDAARAAIAKAERSQP